MYNTILRIGKYTERKGSSEVAETYADTSLDQRREEAGGWKLENEQK